MAPDTFIAAKSQKSTEPSSSDGSGSPLLRFSPEWACQRLVDRVFPITVPFGLYFAFEGVLGGLLWPALLIGALWAVCLFIWFARMPHPSEPWKRRQPHLVAFVVFSSIALAVIFANRASPAFFVSQTAMADAAEDWLADECSTGTQRVGALLVDVQSCDTNTVDFQTGNRPGLEVGQRIISGYLYHRSDAPNTTKYSGLVAGRPCETNQINDSFWHYRCRTTAFD